MDVPELAELSDALEDLCSEYAEDIRYSFPGSKFDTSPLKDSSFYDASLHKGLC
jgi:hypothetical protein